MTGYSSLLGMVALFGLLLAPHQSHAEEKWFSGRVGAGTLGNPFTVKNGDVYYFNATSGTKSTTFLTGTQFRDFKIYTQVPDYPTTGEGNTYFINQPFASSIERPDWLVQPITTWAAPVISYDAGRTFIGNSANQFAMRSSDALDAAGNLRIDKENIAWALLQFEGLHNGTPFINIENPNSNTLTLELEHIVFQGGRNAADGYGSILRFYGARAKELTINGSVGFANNITSDGAALHTTSRVTFTDNVFFDSNLAGGTVRPPPMDADNRLEPHGREPGMIVTDFLAMNKAGGNGGAIYVRYNSPLVFQKDVTFTNNAAAATGGAIYLARLTDASITGHAITFGGKAVFYGNTAGQISTASGHGGAIATMVDAPGDQAFNKTTTILFNDESYFIGNRATGHGGALYGAQALSIAVNFTFEKKALFTDNRAGQDGKKVTIVAVGSQSVTHALDEVVSLPTFIGDGGAIAQRGDAGNNMLVFRSDVEFARNYALGSGGAINKTGNAGTFLFHDNATFISNAAGKISPVGSGTGSNSAALGGAIRTLERVGFANTNNGTLIASGNFAFFNHSGTSTAPDGQGGAIYSSGGNSAVWIDQRYSFTKNQSGLNGGAIMAIGTSSGAINGVTRSNYSLELLKPGLFSENFSTNGGAIYTTRARITSGAVFENNSAASLGGAILLHAGAGRPRLTLTADTEDIIFTGNRSGVQATYSNVDFEKILSTTVTTSGYISVLAGSGSKNDIHFVSTNTTAVVTGTLQFTTGAGRKIYFDGGITQDTDAANKALILVTAAGEGIVEFDGANVELNADTAVNAGTLRLSNNTIYGLSNSASNTKFEVKSGATLEGNGLVQSATINFNTGATVRVLDGGSLRMSSANAVVYGTNVNMAGNGTLYTGAETGTTVLVKNVSVGDMGHASAQMLTLMDSANQGLTVGLNSSELTFGLFAGNASDSLKVGALDLGTSTNTINLSTLTSGSFTLVQADTLITNTATDFNVSYKGSSIAPNNRLTVKAGIDSTGKNVSLTYSATNAVVTWTAASGTLWNTSDSSWTGAGVTDGKFLHGDAVIFSPGRDITINTEVGVSGMTVTDNIFTGSAGITIDKNLWNGGPNSAANGMLVKNGANTTLYLVNATAAGAANQFEGIILNAGTILFGSAKQLGTSLSNIQMLGGTSDNATLYIGGVTTLEGNGGNQRLALLADKVGNINLLNGRLTVTNNNVGNLNGGVFYIGDNATLNLTISGSGRISLLDNTANKGGAVYMEGGAKMNVFTGSGAIVSFGDTDINAARLDPRVLKADTLASADATAVLTKTGAGTLLINGDNSDYKGQLLINSGTVRMSANSTLGGDVTVNNAGSTFGVTSVLGNLTANANTTLQIGDLAAATSVPQTLATGGTLTLDNATVHFDTFTDSLLAPGIFTDQVKAATLNLSGTNYFDFNFGRLATGIYKIAAIDSGTYDTTAVNNIRILSGGQSIVGKRVEAALEVSGSAILLDYLVHHIRLTWTGSAGNRNWGYAESNWSAQLDNRFLDGDSVVFDSANDISYNPSNPVVNITSEVTASEMIVSGTGNYTFTGKSITINKNTSHFVDSPSPTGTLEMNGTGTLFFANEKNAFVNGVNINSGVLQGNNASLNGNKIKNTGLLVFSQTTAGEYQGEIAGSGNIIKSGIGALTFSNLALVQTNNLSNQNGTIIVERVNYLNVTGTLDNRSYLMVKGLLQAGVLVNSGTLARESATATSTQGGSTIMGNYVGLPGSQIDLIVVATGEAADSFTIYGNADGVSRINMNPKYWVDGVANMPAPKRDIRLLTVLGNNQLQLDNTMGETFQFHRVTSSTITPPGETVPVVVTSTWNSSEFMLIQGRDKSVFLRNLDATPQDYNLPMIAAAPAVAEFMGRAANNAFFQRINARHEKLDKGATIWTNYAHSQDCIRGEYYKDTRINTDVIQIGGDYVFSDSDDNHFAQFSGGLSYAYVAGRAERKNQSTISVDSHGLNAYATLALGRFYATALASFSPSATFETVTTDTLDSDGTVKGDRVGAAIEVGYILHPRRTGQLEPYIQVAWQQLKFGEISKAEKDYGFNNRDTANGRDYSFEDNSSINALAGLRWSGLFTYGSKFALKPWGGANFGYTGGDSYKIAVGRHVVEKDMSGQYYTLSGGLSGLLANRIEAYMTVQWTMGNPASNLTLLGGVNYRW